MVIEGRGRSHDSDAPPGDLTSDAGARQPGTGGGNLSGATAASGRRTRRPTGSAVQPCPLAQRVRLVEIVEVVTQGGRETTRPVAAREQFINLDAQVNPTESHPDYGREIRLKARVMWAAGDLTRRPIATKNIYWYATAAAGNRAGLTGNELPAIGGSSSPLRASSPTATDAEGWTSVVTLRLSTYGGDEFTAHATEDSNYTGGLPAGPYTVWRRFWFQVTEMQDGQGGVFALTAPVSAPMITSYQAVFIRMEEEGPRTRVAHRDNLRDQALRAAHAAPQFRANDKVPFKCHVVALDHASDISDKRITGTLTAPSAQTGEIHLWTREPGAYSWKVRARCRRSGAVSFWHCNRSVPACPGHDRSGHTCDGPANATWRCGASACPSHSQPSHVCREGVWHCGRTTPACPGHSRRWHRCAADSGTSWNCGAQHCPGHRSRGDQCGAYWQEIPNAALTLSAPGAEAGMRRVLINLSAGPILPTATRLVEIELVVRECDYTLGWGGGARGIYLCAGNLREIEPAANWTTFQRNTFVHEIGHGLGLVNKTPAAAGAHNAWEETAADHGHHCIRGAATCAMYWANSTTRVITFHRDADLTGCHDHLRRQDFSRTPMAHWSR
ncbi:MAG TPA: hypothetical protein VNE39_02905 [Planctomycetota bacterium]|nr:hypothetical protein [Planctomycetota bacterium]